MARIGVTVPSWLVSAAVMLAACGSSPSKGNQGGNGGGGLGGSSTLAGTGGMAGGDGTHDAEATSPGPMDAGAKNDTAVAADANADDAPVGADAIGGTGGSSNTGGAGQGGTATGGAVGTAGIGGTGGTGGATTCTPVALTDKVNAHWGQLGNYLATDGTNVYWMDLLTGNTTARLNRVSVAGGTAVTMAYEEGIPQADFYTLLAIDSTNVYFNPYYITGGRFGIYALWAIPKGAGPAPQTGGMAMCDSTWASVNGDKPCPATQYGGGTLVTASLNEDQSRYVGMVAGGGYGLISTGKEVCYVQSIDAGINELRCVAATGGNPVTLVKGTPSFHASLATDGTNVFYQMDATNSPLNVDIMSVPIAGGTPVKVGSYKSNLPNSLFFLVNAGYLYWAPTYGTGNDTIMKIPTSGGTSVVLASNQNMNVDATAFPATDGKNLYWWGAGMDNLPQIMKMSVNGGTPTVFVKIPTEHTGGMSVVVDDTSVYWMHPPYLYKCPK